MKVALLGTKSFGVAALEQLQKRNHEVVVVVGDDTVRKAAEERGVRHAWKKGHTRQDVSHLINVAQPHIVVAAHWTAKVHVGRIEAPVMGIHPSLLPRWRGIDAVRWTVKEGDAVAGSSAYWMDDGYDTGPVITQRWGFVDPAWDASTLWRELLFPLGIEAMDYALWLIVSGKGVGEPQNEAYATYAPIIEEEVAVP
jgi:methionyl-tRNA formyltransferase